MDDLEITKKCAEAMGETVQEYNGYLFFHGPSYDSAQHQKYYNPLHDDAQCMALVKRFGLSVNGNFEGDWNWEVIWFHRTSDDEIRTESKDLNRAICECVARMKP